MEEFERESIFKSFSLLSECSTLCHWLLSSPTSAEAQAEPPGPSVENARGGLAT